MSMSTRVTDFDPHVFEVALANLERVRDAKSDPSRSKGKTGPETTDRVEANTGHTGLFGKLGRAVVRAYYRFVERTPPVQTSKLEVIREEARRLTGAVDSFRALCLHLKSLQGSDVAARFPVADSLQDRRLKLLADATTVLRGINAAGTCEATAAFPIRQLEKVIETLTTGLQALEKTASAPPAAALPAVTQLDRPASKRPTLALPHALRLEELQSPQAATAAITRLLGDDGLNAKLSEAVRRVPSSERESFTASLAAFAFLADQTLAAPNYRQTRMGWQYPKSRLEYRERRYEGSVLARSEERHEASRYTLREVALAVAGASNPAKALDEQLSASFLDAIGLAPQVTANWHPQTAAVREAIAKEAMLPLRALNETTEDIAGRRVAVEQVTGVVRDICQHIVDGTYREWRNTSPAGTRQLETLTQHQFDAWVANLSVDAPSAHGVTLRTREEDGVDLLWLTKIGGPSHGFDYGGHCLLPLLANGRTRAVLVDDPRWPHNAAARAYLRVLELEDHKPILYLEPMQCDFPYESRFSGYRSPQARHLQMAILAHAAAKAKAMGVPLSIDGSLAPMAQALGLAIERRDLKYVLQPSGGIFEASDTLIGAIDRADHPNHDCVQTNCETTRPLSRLVFTPAEA